MKKTILISSFVMLVSIFVITELVQAQGNSDKGPLTKKVFIHYKNPKGKPANPAKPTRPPKEDEGSYTYLASGMKWKTIENYVVNASEEVKNLIVKGMNTWEEAAGATIFGNITTGNVGVNLNATDEINAIIFAPLDDNSIIAVTYVWGYFNAPPRFREIVEVDMIFNTDSWLTWGTVEIDGTDVMDILNIATHELGHAAGMGDLYDATATQETMYGYSSEGEISKRDLYTGDIAGISKLY
jgi:hypothetical protein